MAKKVDFKYAKIFNYLVIGFFTTVINISIYSILVMININYMISNLVAFCISILFAYITNKKWVFNNSNENEIDAKELTKFFLSRVATLIMESTMLYVCINLFMLNQYSIKIITNIIVIVVNYILSKYIVFEKEKIS